MSTPVRAAHLLGAAEYLAGGATLEELPRPDIGKLLQQGLSALSAPKLGTDEDRRMIALRDFYLLQLPTFEPLPLSASASRFPSTPPSMRPSPVTREINHVD